MPDSYEAAGPRRYYQGISFLRPFFLLLDSFWFESLDCWDWEESVLAASVVVEFDA